MQVIGIIAEYNPFHHGHRFQIDAVRQRFPNARIIAIMSGSFTQRGEPCILDKWTRACHAVLGGVDLVLEHPFVFACRSAQDFARGSIVLLTRLGIISHLAFGTEAEILAPLAELAAAIDSEAIQIRLSEKLRSGHSYARALTNVLTEELNVPEEMLRAPNNILAIEYLRALHSLAPQITPIAIRRVAARHDDVRLQYGITSASSIRKALGEPRPSWTNLQESVMPSVLDDLQSAHTTGIPREDTLLTLLHYFLLVTDSSALVEIYGIAEGIENRLIRSIKTATDYRGFLRTVATKRYPQSRIARLIIHLLLHFTRQQAESFDTAGAAYIRPLAFNAYGRELLRMIKEESTLPIITRVAEYLSSEERGIAAGHVLLQQMLTFDTRATELRLMTTTAHDKQYTDFVTSPKVLS